MTGTQAVKQKAFANFDLLAGYGTMRGLMRAHDWSASPLGEPDAWSPALRTVVSLMLDSRFPMFVAWGPELGFLYNDAYREILGAKHPAALGNRFQDVWAEIWAVLTPLVNRALAGEATFNENLPLIMQRHGHDEQTWFTFSYSPVRDENGAVTGVYCACTETTAQVVAEKRQAFQLELADRLRNLAEPNDITATAAELLGRHLDAARVGYGEIELGEKNIAVFQDWTNGIVASVSGQAASLDGFGPAIIAELRSGNTLRVHDIAADQRSAPFEKAYAGIDTRAMLVVPLIKDGRLTSFLSIGASEPRRWTDEDVVLAEEVAERTWAAVERARAQGALNRQLAMEAGRLRALFAQAPGFMAVLRGPGHVFDLANSAFMQLIGEREVLGKPVREAVPDVEGQGFFELLDQVFTSAKPYHARGARVLLQLTPGAPATERFVDFIYQPVIEADGSVSGIFIEGYDVTNRKRADEALRASEERLREGLFAGRMVVWNWNIATGQMDFSDNAQEIFGGAWEKSSACWESVHPDDVQRLREAADRAIAERSQYECVVRMIRPDSNDIIWIEIRGKVICDTAGTPQFVRGISLDITQRKIAEDGLRAADRRKDEFLAMLAHELRNPLAPISAAAQLLKLIRIDEPRVQQTSEIIARQVDHMTSLIDDLLDVSRVTRGLITLEKQALDLGNIVASAIEQVRALIESRRHHLTVQMPPVPVRVLGDRIRLVQVVTNLLNNAAKYTLPGGEILLRVELDHGQIVLGVRDSGIGIAPELLPHVFELFTQAERSPDRSQGGLGLGLALVKSLVELHGGTVSARSGGPGKGSEFIARFPHAADLMKPSGYSTDERAMQIAGAKLHLMVVDDNADAANSVALLLESEGHIVSVEYDGKSALKRARIETPKIFLLDIGLPDMDGYELACRLRSIPETAQAVLIALTGYGQAQDRARSKAAGFDYHLVKPADVGKLSALLAQIGSSPALGSNAA
jgi:signal transduction histidine kinase/ActR/RegA family two-component response regulator